MLYPILSAISFAIGITSGIVQIREAIRSHPGSHSQRQKYLWVITISTLLLAVIFLVVSMPFLSLPGNSLLPGSNNSPQGTVTAVPTSSQTPSPTPSPSPSPTPSPTPEPRSYRADWSKGMGGWVQSDGWSAVNGMLVNDGSDYNNDGHPTAIAPTFPQDITNYSVQADIRLDRYTDEGNISGEAGFGIVVRSPDQMGGYKLGVCASGGIYSCGNAAHELLLSDGFVFQDPPVKQSQFRPTEGTWYTYRIDVQGNTVTVWINGSMLFQATDNKYLTAGSVGLWSDRSQVSVRKFTITAL